MRQLLLIFTTLLVVPFALSAESEERISDQEVSLEGDRKALEKLRQDIPEEVKKENDDLGFVLRLFDDKSRLPSKIRSEFNKAYNRMRKKRQRKFKKQRDEYTRAEKKKRKTFVKETDKKKKEFLAKKPSKDAKKEFFDDERTARKEFFADEKIKRKDFESDLRSKRRASDDYMKDVRKDFDDRLRQFTKEQKEMKAMEKRARLQRQQPKSAAIESDLSTENKKYLNDFEKIPKNQGHMLAPQDEK